MSIADNFDSAPDAGFVQFYDSRDARRQFRVSVALVLILTLAAFVLGFLVRFDDSAINPNPAPSVQHKVVLLGA